MVLLGVYAIVAVTVIVSFMSPISCSEKVLLTVYYESKCKDTRSFVLEQLQPTVRTLQDYLKVKLVPFGKSMSLDYGMAGFECQHGQDECYGNMVHDCTLEMMKNKGSRDVQKVDYLACEMKTYAGAMKDMQCVEKVAKLKPEVVKKCVELGKGTVLQLDSEYSTKLIEPKSVPAITIDGVYDQEVQDTAMKDLMGALCSFLQQAKPCLQYYNTQAMQFILKPQSLDRRYVVSFDTGYFK